MKRLPAIPAAVASSHELLTFGEISTVRWLPQACLVCEGETNISSISETLAYFSSLDWLFYGSGIILLILGFMGWATHKKNSHRHSWGKRIFGIGVLFTVIGFNMGAFFSLINYVLP